MPRWQLRGLRCVSVCFRRGKPRLAQAEASFRTPRNCCCAWLCFRSIQSFSRLAFLFCGMKNSVGFRVGFRRESLGACQQSSESKQLNVAVIGYGMAAKVFHTPLISSVRGLRLSHIVSTKPDVVKQDWPGVAVLATPADAFAHPEIDLIVVATPNDSHFDLAQRALAAGKHVVVDKPFTTTVAEATELAALAKKSGRVLAVFQNRRWDGDFLTLRALIAEGRLGEVTHFESHYDRYRPLVRKRWREQAGTGERDLVRPGAAPGGSGFAAFRQRRKEFSADLEMQREGAQTVDYFHVTFRYGRARVILHASSLVRGDLPRLSCMDGRRVT